MIESKKRPVVVTLFLVLLPLWLLGSGGGASGAAGVLGRLTGQKDVQSQPGYAAGQAGQVQAPGGQALSLDGLRGQVKNQVCNLVLNRAKAFL